MKWIGQHIWDYISRFRNDVYLEDLSTTTESNVLVVDSNGKISKNTSVGGDITGVTITTDSGGGSAASDTSGSADFSILGSSGVGVTNRGTTITAVSVPGEIDHNSLLNYEAGRHYAWASDVSGTATIHTNNITDLHGAGVDGSINQLLTDDGDGTVTSEAYMTFENSSHVSDFKILSSQNVNDLFRVRVTTNGQTTIQTEDGDAALANLQITADGTAELAGTTVTLDSAGAITFERGSSTVEVPDVAGTLQVVDLVKYLLPSDFIVNDASFVRGYLYAADDAGSDYGGTWQDAGLQSWAWYQVPKGFKVTHMHAYGNTTSSTDASIYQLDPTDGTRGSALASGEWNTNRSLSTAITSADDAVVLVVVDNNANTDIIYSVKLTLALV